MKQMGSSKGNPYRDIQKHHIYSIINLMIYINSVPTIFEWSRFTESNLLVTGK